MPLDGLDLAIALAVALVSAFIRGLSGFGMALMLVPVLALTVEPVDAVLAANILGAVMGFASWRGARHKAQDSAKRIALLAMLATPAGLGLLAITPDALARVLIALVASTAFAAFILPEPRLSDRHVNSLAAGAGLASGLCAGLAGMPGPPVIAYYFGLRVEKAQARASMFVVFLATSIAACLSALALGVGSMAAIWLAAMLTPVVLVGNWLGSLAFGKVNDIAWRLFAGTIVAASAVIALKDVVQDASF